MTVLSLILLFIVSSSPEVAQPDYYLLMKWNEILKIDKLFAKAGMEFKRQS